jgi:hypothetical protein
MSLGKIAQNVAQPIFVKVNTNVHDFMHGEKYQAFWAIFVKVKKTAPRKQSPSM